MFIEIIIIAFLAILAAVILFYELRQMKAQIRNQEKRISELEKASRLRMPQKSMNEILNAMAALNKEVSEFEFFKSVIENAQGHLANALSIGTVREK